MSTSKQKRKPSGQTRKKRKKQDKSVFRVRWLIIILVIVVIVILFLAIGKLSRNNNDGLQSAVSPKLNNFNRLVGSWVRPDGGYILKIYSVDPNGKVKAGYYNPNHINVSESFVNVEDNRIKLFIKLQDEGYPGSTYTLFYNPSSDAFLGIYYQAAKGQSFEVAFVRKK